MFECLLAMPRKASEHKKGIMSLAIVAMIIASIGIGILVTLPKPSVAATQEDWDRTNWNYTVGFAPTRVRANADYVFTATGDNLYQNYRNNGTLKQNLSLPANLTSACQMQCDDDYLFIVGRVSGEGCRIAKYSLPDLTWVDEYTNSTWNYNANLLINATCIWLSGSSTATDGSIIKLNRSDMTETVYGVTRPKSGDDRMYEMVLDSTETYLYTVHGVYEPPAYIAKFYAGNLTFINETAVAETYLKNLIRCSDDCYIAASCVSEGYIGKIQAVNDSLMEQWNNTWADAEPRVKDLEELNSTHFFTAFSTGLINCSYSSNGTANWSYTGFDTTAGYFPITHYGNYLYACGMYDGARVLRNITAGEAAAEDETSVSVSGLTSGMITWSGYAGDTVWSNSSGIGNETMIVMIIDGVTTVTEIRISTGDLNDTGLDIDASNIAMEVSNDNGTWSGNTIAFDADGSNISINSNQWSESWCNGDNPFPITGDDNIYVRFKIVTPGDQTVDYYFSLSMSAWKGYILG